MNTLLLVLALLQLKHLIIDWILQPAYMHKNKGIYGHLGGILHAGFNALGTAACLLLLTPHFFLVFVVDFTIHYHIDWSKMNINSRMGWGPTTHNEFWWLTGFDQFLHQITYLGLIYMSL